MEFRTAGKIPYVVLRCHRVLNTGNLKVQKETQSQQQLGTSGKYFDYEDTSYAT